ncbi:DUF4382 domain-containing protein [Pleurocapsales cyanobacterium LEGE 10410]|nr:DUF4382 domain-containing protein [Pleurocapsales cyanobacterium LEGE 10410]
MNKVRIITYGIILGSVILSGFSRSEKQTIAATEEGTLTLVANGEDFVRQGFVSKDGWRIDFDRLYVNFSAATAYSTESSFEPQKGDTKESIEYQHRIEFFDGATTADLAAGEANAEPIVVAQADVPTGFYNALTWKISTAEGDSPIAGNTIALLGQATKDGQTINFDLGFNQPAEYICGEFVGESRQGIVTADTSGQVEATFHFDHIFGDADTPPEDALNQDALGFQPLAELASNGTLQLDDAELASQLSEQEYQQLTEAVSGLGHVGEGHCIVSTAE